MRATITHPQRYQQKQREKGNITEQKKQSSLSIKMTTD